MDIKTGKETQLNQPNKRLISIAVSLDNKWIAYRQTVFGETGTQQTEDNLVIADIDNQVRNIIAWEKGWGLVRAWLDNQNIVIDIPPEDIIEEPATLLILNVFTGKRLFLKPDYPGIYSLPPVPYWRGWGETVYVADLRRVIYLRGGEDGKSSPIELTLWDVTFSVP
jgi:hypothetical protein